MSTQPGPAPPRRAEGWFYMTMALVALAIALAGFGPAALDPESRRSPLTLPLVAHGAVFGTWLLLFLTQVILVPRGLVDIHRRLGHAGAGLAVVMVISGYLTAIAMARRGYDLGGDLVATGSDAREILVFQLGDLLSFSVLVGVGIAYRRRPAVHKRLMLLATVGSLMPAALAHIIGHSPTLRQIQAPIILIPLILLFFAPAVHDRISHGRIHQVSLWTAVALLVWANLRAAVIGPSSAWHSFATWLAQWHRREPSRAARAGGPGSLATQAPGRVRHLRPHSDLPAQIAPLRVVAQRNLLLPARGGGVGSESRFLLPGRFLRPAL